MNAYRTTFPSPLRVRMRDIDKADIMKIISLLLWIEKYQRQSNAVDDVGDPASSCLRCSAQLFEHS